MPRLLMILVAVFVILALIWPLLARMGLGKIPGDIIIDTETGKIYLPIVSSAIVSLIITFIIWLL